jgi:hypothetical protein
MHSTDVVIRAAEPADLQELMRLAELDSRHMPAGHVLIAKADGRTRAAIGVDDGRLISDPFVPTGSLVDLLELRASQIRSESRRERRRLGLRNGLRLRLGGATS